jgi:hypothetical protein
MPATGATGFGAGGAPEAGEAPDAPQGTGPKVHQRQQWAVMGSQPRTQ